MNKGLRTSRDVPVPSTASSRTTGTTRSPLTKRSSVSSTSSRRRSSAGLFATNYLRQFRDYETQAWKPLSAHQFAAVWEHYDKDGNGYIEGTELDAFLRELVGSVVPEGVSQQVISAAAMTELKRNFMEAYDDNDDNRIEIGELAPVLPTDECFLLLFRRENPLDSSVHFMEVWQKFDKNNSGYIEKEELDDFLLHLLQEKGREVSAEKFREYSCTILQLFDINRDGKLQLSEMARLLPVKENYLTKSIFKGTFSHAEVLRIFRKYDVNQNGQIDGVELDGLLKDLLDLTETSYDDEKLKYLRHTILEQFDTNGDGTIDRHELKLMLQQQRRLAQKEQRASTVRISTRC